mgnify:CR=1 FL=1
MTSYLSLRWSKDPGYNQLNHKLYQILHPERRNKNAGGLSYEMTLFPGLIHFLALMFKSHNVHLAEYEWYENLKFILSSHISQYLYSTVHHIIIKETMEEIRKWQ